MSNILYPPVRPISQTMRSFREVALDSFVELINPYPSTAIKFWPMFTEVTGGLRSKEFTIFCGATGVGKTTFLANLSLQLLLQKTKHYVASVETGDTDFVKRIFSAALNEDVNQGLALAADKVLDIQRKWKHLLTEDLMLSVFDNRMAMDLLLDELRIAYEVHGCQVALLDNLNFFLEVSSAQNSVLEMDRAIHKLIMFCKEVPMHVIMVMHPKKTEHGRVESEFDIKGSSTAVQEAHNVFLFNRPSDNDVDHGFDRNLFRELKIAKLRRRGQYVGKSIMFKNFNSGYVEFEIK